MSTLRRAIVYSFASRYALRLIGLASTMIVARLLTPAEIGTFAIASAIVLIASEFRLLGAGMYLVREQDIPPEKIRSALGLTFLISWGLGLAIFISAPWAAEFYELPDVANIFRILSVSFLLAPYISIPTALLQRTYKFDVLFRVTLLATVVGFVGTIGFILLDFSYFALAIGQILKVVAEFFLIIWFWPKRTPWIPLFSGLKPIAGFGVYTSIVNLLRRAHVTLPDMIIGKLGTSTQVAMYSRGLGLIDFLSQTLMAGVGPVGLSYLSDTKRSGGNVAEAYTRASVMLGGIVCPVLAVAGLASEPTIRLFFGSQWDAAAPIAAWLALWGIIRCLHWLSSVVLMVQGSEKLLALKEFFVFIVFFAAIAGLYPYGLEAIALGFVGAAILDFLASSVALHYTIGLEFISFVRSWASNIAITAACAGATLLISLVIDFSTRHFWIPILAIAIVMPVVWLASVWLFKHPLFAEIERLIPKKFKRPEAGA